MSRRSFLLFRDFHRFAQEVEQAVFLQKIYKNTNKQLYQKAKQDMDKQLILMEEWKDAIKQELEGKTGRIFWGG
jgi:hypothetical protein